MKALVVYDSVYGNTEQIARAIGSAIEGEVKVLKASEAGPSEMGSLDLLVVGAPTQGGRATPAARNFLNGISKGSLKGVNVASFDTRVSTRWVGIFGYAAGRIGKNLQGNGGTLVAPPEGFFVQGTQGPLKEGELERAAAWAKGLVAGKG